MTLTKLLAPYKCLSITGICKNAGKTTLLNTLIEGFERQGDNVLAITSIGLDGEKTDVLFGTDKPQVYVKEGMLFATAKELLPLCTATKEIVAVTDFFTPLGVVVVCRALSGGKVILAGPSITDQLVSLKETFYKKGAQRVLIDGALSRRSLITAKLSDACLLVAGASFSPNYDALIEETLFNIDILTLPLAKKEEKINCGAENSLSLRREELAILEKGEKNFAFAAKEKGAGSASAPKKISFLSKEGGSIYFEGAITDATVMPLITAKGKNSLIVAAEDNSKIMLSKETFYRAKASGVNFAVKKSVNLAAVAVNPYSVEGYTIDAKKFISDLRGKTALPIYDTRGNL